MRLVTKIVWEKLEKTFLFPLTSKRNKVIAVPVVIHLSTSGNRIIAFFAI